ncbi:antibiotic biosynthesis monooxygenase [Microvirga sp. 2MCAF35]|uniref:antibiotic biosynthesis monooxygenase family protein n=1 Tax=Microvirga sp. 2MCAF35 TaxID=3232987 RepID=UPI003F9B65CE
MTSRVLETVTFALLPGTNETAFLQAAEDAGAVAKAMPGFIARRLVKTQDSTWIDLVEWQDAASAKHAAETFHTVPAAQPFCGMIDMASAKMAHHTITVSS